VWLNSSLPLQISLINQQLTAVDFPLVSVYNINTLIEEFTMSVYIINDSYLQQMAEEEEMHFYSCVNDVKEAFDYHGLPAILHEVMKEPKYAKMVAAYFNNETVSAE
jgi:hypothetical protein